MIAARLGTRRLGGGWLAGWLAGSLPARPPSEPGFLPQLLAGQKKSAPFWTFEYYQTFFDVDTYQVLDRIKGSVLPIPGKNFVRLYIRSNPDLYGPFWICATLVFAIAISGNLANFFLHLGKQTYHYVPEFRKVSIAATAIYTYAWLVPLALWGFLVWRNSRVVSLVSYSFLEIVCVYGYSLFIYIPTAILWIIPQKAIRWILLFMALGLSGSVLVMTFWPAVRDDNRRVALATVGAIVLLHSLLAVGCLVGRSGASFPTPGVGCGGGNSAPYTGVGRLGGSTMFIHSFIHSIVFIERLLCAEHCTKRLE
uniref:Protein YIPF n=1 Tax=Ornithorhynchus anatinus TaxID=9258 RepID=F6UG43_ORNAN